MALAHILAEDRVPNPSLWTETLVSSRLTEYEIWTRLHARKLGATHGREARELMDRIALLELSPPILARALEPFPVAVRTLDAIHLSSMSFLVRQRKTVRLASYDDRLTSAAIKLGIKPARF